MNSDGQVKRDEFNQLSGWEGDTEHFKVGSYNHDGNRGSNPDERAKSVNVSGLSIDHR